MYICCFTINLKFCLIELQVNYLWMCVFFVNLPSYRSWGNVVKSNRQKYFVEEFTASLDIEEKAWEKTLRLRAMGGIV